jgi:hypothetical protein
MTGARDGAGRASMWCKMPIDDLLRAKEAIESAPWEPHPCKLGRHLLPPRVLDADPGETFYCINCGSPVTVPGAA